MTKLFSLFSSEAEVTQAVDALTKQVPEVETEVIYSESEAQRTQMPMASGSPLPGATGTPIVNVVHDRIKELAMNDNEAEFYVRGLKNGGALLIVETDEEQVDAARRILRSENGRWPNQT